jgi:hypothetical protein
MEPPKKIDIGQNNRIDESKKIKNSHEGTEAQIIL